MPLRVYSYVGPDAIRDAAKDDPAGTSITSTVALRDWLAENPEGLTEGATYIISLEGTLRLAPRRSEHIACAGGTDVLAAGEIRFEDRGRGRFEVIEVSNQSTGYCPDGDCWEAVRAALTRAGLAAPPAFTHEIVFRRCPQCGERNLVKDAWFECVFCAAELPRQWNF